MTTTLLRSLLLAFLFLGCAPGNALAQRRATRALWVTRFDFRTREDVARAIENAHSAAFDAVLFQVRGNATAFYRRPVA